MEEWVGWEGGGGKEEWVGWWESGVEEEWVEEVCGEGRKVLDVPLCMGVVGWVALRWEWVGGWGVWVVWVVWWELRWEGWEWGE